MKLKIGAKSLEIKYFNRELNKLETEKVYGDKAVSWLYDSASGRALTNLLIKKPLSQVYGMVQSSSLTERKVKPFIRDFNINMDEYQNEDGRGPESPFSSFNSFFIRRFKDDARKFNQESNIMPAFCEARYFGHESLNTDVTIPVKGKNWLAKDLIANEKWSDTFKDGPCLLARLCPVDYHRFHFPVAGSILDDFRVSGLLHSVNPLALAKVPEVLSVNERHVSILETPEFGKLAYIEVGAICVGKIIQSRELKGSFERGEEKGYFLFGGSTVIVLGEKGRWAPDPVVLENTQKGIEVYQKLGSAIALKL